MNSSVINTPTAFLYSAGTCDFIVSNSDIPYAFVNYESENDNYSIDLKFKSIDFDVLSMLASGYKFDLYLVYSLNSKSSSKNIIFKYPNIKVNSFSENYGFEDFSVVVNFNAYDREIYYKGNTMPEKIKELINNE